MCGRSVRRCTGSLFWARADIYIVYAGDEGRWVAERVDGAAADDDVALIVIGAVCFVKDLNQDLIAFGVDFDAPVFGNVTKGVMFLGRSVLIRIRIGDRLGFGELGGGCAKAVGDEDLGGADVAFFGEGIEFADDGVPLFGGDVVVYGGADGF